MEDWNQGDKGGIPEKKQTNLNLLKIYYYTAGKEKLEKPQTQLILSLWAWSVYSEVYCHHNIPSYVIQLKM